MPVPPVIQMYRYVMGSGGGLGNLLKASEEFQQTVDWVRYPTSSQTPTVNADSRPDPNGGTTADQVDYTANTGARLMQTVTLKASTEYTFSVHARAVSGTVDFRMRNITLKAAVQKTATTTGPLTNGFTRFTYTFTTGAAGSYELALQNASGTPTARSVIFWGAMLNQGGTAADYEYAAPTTGGSAPAPAYAGFGDAFGGVTAYYSLRQFTEAETLNAIRVRRSSDDTEQDIGFDANGDLDTTALTTFVNADVDTYTSDFSSTEDLNESNGTGAAAQSVGGVDDAYKFTLSGGAVSHFPRVLGALNTNDTFNISFDFYIPSSNSACDGVQLYLLSGSPLYNTLDAWTSVSLTNVTSSSDQLRFYATDGGSLTVNGDGDVFYLKNIVVTQTTADGAVTTFYDQSGNGNDATNATESEQPLVVSGGTLVEENSKASVKFDNSVTYNSLEKQFASALSQPVNIFGVVQNNDGDKDHFYDGYTNRFSFGYDNTSLTINAGNGISAGAYATGLKLISNLYNTTSSELNINGVTENSGNVGTNTMDGIVLGTLRTSLSASIRTDYGLNGNIQEIIIFNSDQSANRTGIESNINDHFTIYP